MLENSTVKNKFVFEYEVNPQALVAQKIADEVFFDVSKVKESSFF